MTEHEPILHLARRASKHPETLRMSDTRRLADWVLLAYKQREREVGMIAGYSQTPFTIEGNEVLEIGRVKASGAAR